MAGSSDRNPREAGRQATSAASRQSSQPGHGDRAFDMWLNRGLHSIFDTIASEPVPEDLLRLIENDRSASGRVVHGADASAAREASPDPSGS